MDFTLTEEQLLLKKTVRRLMEEEIAPTVREYDEREEFPWEHIEKLRSLGLLGMAVPEEYGGMGANYVTVVIAVEEVSRVSGSLGISMILQNGGLPRMLALVGSAEQKKKYLPPIGSGEKLIAAGITEPGAGSDVPSMRTRAERNGNYYVLNGQKCFISNGGVAEIYFIFAKTDPTRKADGISTFILEKGVPGFMIGKKEQKLGFRSNPTTELIFDHCQVPAESLLGPEGQGFYNAMTLLNAERILNGTITLGLAQGAYDKAIQYVQGREAFGCFLADYQGLQWMLADMAIQLEAARLLLYKAAFLVDAGLPFIKEASIAKVFANEMSIRVINDAIQLHGGYGYMRDYEIERHLRDARGLMFGGGTPQINRNNISRLILKEAGYVRKKNVKRT